MNFRMIANTTIISNPMECSSIDQDQSDNYVTMFLDKLRNSFLYSLEPVSQDAFRSIYTLLW